MDLPHLMGPFPIPLQQTNEYGALGKLLLTGEYRSIWKRICPSAVWCSTNTTQMAASEAEILWWGQTVASELDQRQTLAQTSAEWWKSR